MDIVDEIRADREAGALRLEREYKSQLLAVAARFCPDPIEAEALVCRTMDETIRRIETLADPGSFFGWMCGIMSNQYGKLNRRKIDGKISYTDQLPELEDESVGVDRIISAVDGEILHQAIEHLPPKLKEAILLRYFVDMPLSQIARFLMIPVGTVNSRLHMARVVLAMRLGAKLKKPIVAMIAAALLLFGVTAAVIGFRSTETANEDAGETGLGAVNRDAVAENGSMQSPDTPDSVGFADPSAQNAPESQGVATTPISQSTSKGEKTMKKGKAAAAALSVAFAAAPLMGANGDEYQFIDPDTYPAANYSHKASSSVVSLNAGAVPVAGVAVDLEARSRSNGISAAITLNATQFRGFYISFK